MERRIGRVVGTVALGLPILLALSLATLWAQDKPSAARSFTINPSLPAFVLQPAVVGDTNGREMFLILQRLPSWEQANGRRPLDSTFQRNGMVTVYRSLASPDLRKLLAQQPGGTMVMMGRPNQVQLPLDMLHGIGDFQAFCDAHGLILDLGRN